MLSMCFAPFDGRKNQINKAFPFDAGKKKGKNALVMTIGER